MNISCLKTCVCVCVYYVTMDICVQILVFYLKVFVMFVSLLIYLFSIRLTKGHLKSFTWKQKMRL